MFLYYARAVNHTILVALNIISVEQANSTETTTKAFTQLLNYSVMYSEAITRYYANHMILHIHGNASFLSEPGAKSIAGGCHFLRTASVVPNKSLIKQPPPNGPVHVKFTTIRNVLYSTMEAELGALFVNCQIGADTCMALIKMGHAYPSAP